MTMNDSDRTATAILARAINPENGSWSPDASRSILNIKLPKADCDVRDALAEKAREGTLNEAGEQELENYRHAGRILELMKAKARISLKKATAVS